MGFNYLLIIVSECFYNYLHSNQYIQYTNSTFLSIKFGVLIFFDYIQYNNTIMSFMKH